MENTNIMPHNLEAEQSILGCIMIDNEIAADVLSVLSEEDFYQDSHKYIINAFKAVYNARQPIDLVTVSDKLEAGGELEKVGGISYLTELVQITPSAANYQYYLDIVKRDSTNRKLIRAAREITDYAKKSDDAVKSIQFAEDRIYSVSKTQNTSKVVDVSEVGFWDILDKFNTIQNDKDALRGVMTGFFRLDKITNGLQKSDLIIIAARPGVGKTSFAMNIVEHAALDGNVCAVFSLEMSDVQIRQRLICTNANVSMSVAFSGQLQDNNWRRLASAANQSLKDCKISIIDNARITPAEILSQCRRIKAKNNGRLDLVMIDYIQLMSSGKKNDENRTLEVASITRELKIIAKELQVPIIALSQLRRLKAGEKSSLSDLRESGSIEQDADIVMFIDRNVDAPDTVTRNTAELRIAKHRNGECGILPLRFKGETTKFVDAEIEG